MQTLNTNISSIKANFAAANAQTNLSRAIERLSSGLRIKSASDDAAGLGVSQELQRQTRSLEVSARNANDAVSMLQTADGSLTSVSDILQRMKQLSVQGANDTLSKEQRKFITAEMAELKKEINAIATRTTYNDARILTGNFQEGMKDQFNHKTGQLDGKLKSVLASSTFQAGLTSETSASTNASTIVDVTRIEAQAATAGTYKLSSTNNILTLSVTRNGVTTTDSISLVSGPPSNPSEVTVPSSQDETFELNFRNLDIKIDMQVSQMGNARTPREFATQIASIGIQPDLDYKNTWKAVEGANWDPGYAAANWKAVVSASGGEIRLTSAANITSVRGYNGASNDVSTNLTTWSDGTSYEIAFQGSKADVQAALDGLEIKSADGKGSVTVEIVPANISVFTLNGVTSYYEVVNGYTPWDSARTSALGKSFQGLSGYLTNINSAEENAFVASKLVADSWMGGSDDVNYVNDALNRKNGTTGVVYYANQAAVEGKFFWIDGPQAGTQFLNGNGIGGGGPAGGVPVAGVYSNFESSWQPDGSGGVENYVQFYASNNGKWNDLPINYAWIQGYVVEYGGGAGMAADSSRTILIGKPTEINVGTGVSVKSVSTESAEVGVYKLSANREQDTLTLRQYDIDGRTLLRSETISALPQRVSDSGEEIQSLRQRSYEFTQLGLTVDLENISTDGIELGDDYSGLDSEVLVSSSKLASRIGDDGPVFQIGESNRTDIRVNVFRDVRLNNNEDALTANIYNGLGAAVDTMQASTDSSFADFQSLEHHIDRVIGDVSARRAAIGSAQNRVEMAIANVRHQSVNLTSARSQIEDVDFASETARLTRMQIGQQASTAMTAQANALPNVILALLE
jgi:flagellin